FIFPAPTGINCQEQTEKLPGFKIEAPAEVRVQRGLCVHIPCNFTVGPSYTLSRDAIGIWYKGYNGNLKKKIVAASTDSSQFPDTTNGRFIFTGKVSAGDCSFSISDAQPGDAAHYQFRVDSSVKFNYLHTQPSVVVTELKEPDISPTKGLIAGEEVTLTCTAPTNCPGLSPTFTWEGSVNTERTQTHQFDNVTYVSHVTFTPSQTDHNTLLICTVTCKGVSTKQSIILDVECKSPSLLVFITLIQLKNICPTLVSSITVYLSTTYLNKPDIFPIKKLIAGEQVTLTCSAFGTCMETSPTITWAGNINITSVGNDRLLYPASQATYLSHVTFTPSQTDHNTSLTCTVTCKGISTNHSTILDVECKSPSLLVFISAIK
uniref:Ig-like domain-containing protein n=1 Tax=Xenopus tropicalis TaxID=8364 RepID=F7DZK2_XENTR